MKKRLAVLLLVVAFAMISLVGCTKEIGEKFPPDGLDAVRNYVSENKNFAVVHEVKYDGTYSKNEYYVVDDKMTVEVTYLGDKLAWREFYNTEFLLTNYKEDAYLQKGETYLQTIMMTSTGIFMGDTYSTKSISEFYQEACQLKLLSYDWVYDEQEKNYKCEEIEVDGTPLNTEGLTLTIKNTKIIIELSIDEENYNKTTFSTFGKTEYTIPSRVTELMQQVIPQS